MDLWTCPLALMPRTASPAPAASLSPTHLAQLALVGLGRPQRRPPILDGLLLLVKPGAGHPNRACIVEELALSEQRRVSGPDLAGSLRLAAGGKQNAARLLIQFCNAAPLAQQAVLALEPQAGLLLRQHLLLPPGRGRARAVGANSGWAGLLGERKGAGCA